MSNGQHWFNLDKSFEMDIAHGDMVITFIKHTTIAANYVF